MRETLKPCFIGIAGPSGSGKTELAVRVAETLPGSVVLNLDSYYISLDHLPKAERDACNFDVPEMLDWALINEHLEELGAGRAVEVPSYSFETHSREPVTASLHPTPFVIVEGIFALHDAGVRSRLNTSVYVRTPDEVCYERRKARDVVERGRTEESVRSQYEQTVRPGAMRYVWPTEQYAGLVVSGTQLISDSVAEVLETVAGLTQTAC